ncbi:MAG: hypothetical protein U0521_12000 [Anaerolineae bacterium]
MDPNTGAESLVVGALVRDAYAALWRGKAVPGWFSDGLAQFFAPSPKNALLPPAQQAARDGTLLSLGGANGTNSTLVACAGLGMILLIADRIGYQGLFDLARVDADDFDSAYERAMGEPLSGLIPAWREWIFSRDAASGLWDYTVPAADANADFHRNREQHADCDGDPNRDGDLHPFCDRDAARGALPYTRPDPDAVGYTAAAAAVEHAAPAGQPADGDSAADRAGSGGRAARRASRGGHVSGLAAGAAGVFVDSIG